MQRSASLGFKRRRIWRIERDKTGADVLKLRDVADSIRIDHRKLTQYALDADSPHGKHKAVLFERLLGFTKVQYSGLIRQLEANALQAEVVLHSEDTFGRRYTADIPIEGIKGQHAIVTTGWIVAPETREAHLVTLYVKKG